MNTKKITMKNKKEFIKEPWTSSYPTNRDIVLKTSKSWMEGKAKDDKINGPYWRIHNKLYDLSEFADLHPGGKEWINFTKGTDITEAFESAHIFPQAEKLLHKFYVKDIHTPRNSPYTFHEDGFYKTLKKKIRPIIAKVGSGPTLKMTMLMDAAVIVFVTLLFLAAVKDSVVIIMLAGVTLNLVANMAHNFFHQKDNLRMYYFDLTLLSSSDWRISHALSHHLFTNTLMDFEISILEPFLYFLPNRDKTLISRYGSFAYELIIYCIAFYLETLKRVVSFALRYSNLELRNFLPAIEFFVIVYFRSSFSRAFLLWTVMHLTCSFWFAYIGLIAAHHHPDIYHAGDCFRSNPDWGLCQLDAVRDRKEVTGSLFLVSISFGDHTLHHLFPTIDHSKLPHLYPVFLETCKQFNVPFYFIKQKDLFFGKYSQLANVTPNNNVPGYHKKID